MVAQGTTLAGRYRLDSRLGAGGMGEVWRGEDIVLARTVAVKVLLPGRTDDPGFMTRFRNEARAMATINHPGVVDVYDYGVDQVPGAGPQAYLVMRFVDGEALDRLLTRLGRIAPEPAMELIAQAASALQAVHNQGIVHRDIKPGNLLVRADGTLVLTDFGIARADAASRLTDAGMVLGTAAYCAPEQAEGAPVTPAVDIYALGVVAYECLAGHRPFDGDTPVTIALKHIREEPPPLPSDIPPVIRRLVEQALSKDPARRFRDAAEMSEAARQAAAGRGAEAGGQGTRVQPAAPEPDPYGGQQAGYPQTGGYQQAPQTGGYQQAGHPQTGGYQQVPQTGGYQQAGGYDATDAYDQAGYRQDGYAPDGYGQDGYGRDPYDRDGYPTGAVGEQRTGSTTTVAAHGRRGGSGRRSIGVITAVVTAGVLCVGGVAVALADFGTPPKDSSRVAATGEQTEAVAEPLATPTSTIRKPRTHTPRQTVEEAVPTRPTRTPKATTAATKSPTPERTPKKTPTASPSPTPTVVKKAVPAVVGMTLSQARAAVEKLGFGSRVQVNGSGQALACMPVVVQEPEAGVKLEPKKVVMLMVDPDDHGCSSPSPTPTPTPTTSKSQASRPPAE